MAKQAATPKYRISLRSINNFLSLVVVALALYIVAAPFAPQLNWWLHHRHAQTVTVQQVQKQKAHVPVPAGNWLDIPRLSMHQTINTGDSIYTLNKGVWLIPKTSTPDKASNTVMAGHRFTYAGPAVFYFLDKVQMDDPIVIDWNNKEYTYKVTQIQVVPPTDIAVQDPSPQPKVTIYTCTPLWTAKNRLIVVASLVGVRS